MSESGLPPLVPRLLAPPVAEPALERVRCFRIGDDCCFDLSCPACGKVIDGVRGEWETLGELIDEASAHKCREGDNLMTDTPNRSITQRGFDTYDDFTDSHGSRVVIRESSSVDGPHVWIFASHQPEDRFLNQKEKAVLALLDPAFGAKLTPSPHLSVDEARRVRDALDAFVAENFDA